MLELGTTLPDVKLWNPSTEKTFLSKDWHSDKGYLVMFMCNHCPYVVHIREALVALTNDWLEKGIAVIGINSNNPETHPEDRPEKMVEEKRLRKYSFDYLFDETQDVAKTFNAACTPEFYLFNKQKKLVYRGRLDDSTPGNKIPVTGNELNSAVQQLLNNQPMTQDQKPGMGCNIKWKPGNEPK